MMPKIFHCALALLGVFIVNVPAFGSLRIENSHPKNGSSHAEWAQIAPAPKPDAQAPSYLGAFLIAVRKEDIPAIKSFLNKGADPNVQTKDGTRALLIAAKLNNSEIIKLLIEGGALVDAGDGNGMTALMIAASVGQAKNTQVLIQAGANVNAQDNQGNTPLIWATVRGFPAVVEILLANAADIKAKTKNGHTALWLCRSIIADMKRTLANSQKENKELEKKITRYEEVLRFLEEAVSKD
jgi:ankyrin repeat protein